MKFVENINELKKGDILIVKDNEYFSAKGYSTVKGEVFSFVPDKLHFLIKCKETNAIEKINIEHGKIFAIS